MGRGLSAAILIAIMAVMLSVPLADGSDGVTPVECNGTTIMSFDDYVKLDISSSTSVGINIFNNNPGAVTAIVTQADGTPLHVTADRDNTEIDGDTAIELNVKITSDKYASEGIYDLILKITVMNNSGIAETAELPITVVLSSSYSPGDVFNTIMGLFPNPLNEPFDTPLWAAIMSFAGWVIAAFLAVLLTLLALRIVFIQMDADADKISLRAGVSVFVCTLLWGFSNCLRVYGAEEVFIADVQLISGFFYLILGAYILWCIYVVFVARLMKRFEDDGGSVNGVDSTLVPLFNVLGKIVIITITTGGLLSMLGMDMGAIVAGAGIVGLAVSLGAKPAFNELFCGLTLLITRPFVVGDTIIVGNSKDAINVERVGIMNSRFYIPWTTEHFSMPNSVLSSSMITNITGITRNYRTLIYVNIAYGTNIELVKKLMKEAAFEHPNVLKDGSVDRPDVRLMSFGNSSISMRLAVYVRDYDINGGTCGEIRESILRKFKENGVVIPFQQKNVAVFRDRSVSDVQRT